MLYVLGRHQTRAARCSSNCSGVTSLRLSSSALLMVRVPLAWRAKGQRESDEDGGEDDGATPEARQIRRKVINTESAILGIAFYES